MTRRLKLLGNDFTWRTSPDARRCSECGSLIVKGQQELVSIKRGKVKKRICSEACRQTFDDRIWQEIANSRE